MWKPIVMICCEGIARGCREELWEEAMFGFLKRRLRRELARKMDTYMVMIQLSMAEKLERPFRQQYGENGSRLAAAVTNKLFGKAPKHTETELALAEQLASDAIRNDGEVRYAAVMSLRITIASEYHKKNAEAMQRAIDTIQWMAQFGELPAFEPEPGLVEGLAKFLYKKYCAQHKFELPKSGESEAIRAPVARQPRDEASAIARALSFLDIQWRMREINRVHGLIDHAPEGVSRQSNRLRDAFFDYLAPDADERDVCRLLLVTQAVVDEIGPLILEGVEPRGDDEWLVILKPQADNHARVPLIVRYCHDRWVIDTASLDKLAEAIPEIALMAEALLETPAGQEAMRPILTWVRDRRQ